MSEVIYRVNKQISDLLLKEFELSAAREDFGVVAMDTAGFDRTQFWRRCQMSWRGREENCG